MNDLLKYFSADFSDNFSVTTFSVNIVICAVLLFLLRMIYVRYGSSLSNKNQLGRVLILVGLTTFLIISIVKSSLALSLGLVGALSIVRFRTAIKEPEELAFFFIAISLGLGLGANQLLPSILGFLFIVLVVVITKSKNFEKNLEQSLIVNIPISNNEEGEAITNLINSELSSHTRGAELKRLKISKESYHTHIQLIVDSSNDLLNLHKGISSKYPNAEISFIDNKI